MCLSAKTTYLLFDENAIHKRMYMTELKPPTCCLMESYVQRGMCVSEIKPLTCCFRGNIVQRGMCMSELNHVPVVLEGMSSIGACVCHHLPVAYGKCRPEGHVYLIIYLLLTENVVQRGMCMSAPTYYLRRMLSRGACVCQHVSVNYGECRPEVHVYVSTYPLIMENVVQRCMCMSAPICWLWRMSSRGACVCQHVSVDYGECRPEVHVYVSTYLLLMENVVQRCMCMSAPICCLWRMSSRGACVCQHLSVAYGECRPEVHVYVSTYLLIMENVVQRCMCMSAPICWLWRMSSRGACVCQHLSVDYGECRPEVHVYVSTYLLIMEDVVQRCMCMSAPICWLWRMSSRGACVCQHVSVNYGECRPEVHVYVSTYLLIMENVVQRCMCMSARICWLWRMSSRGACVCQHVSVDYGECRPEVHVYVST